MSLEREAMKNKLTEATQRVERLKLKIEGYARSISQGLNVLLTPPADLEIPLLDEQWDELKAAWIDLHVVLGDIAKLEKGLR